MALPLAIPTERRRDLVVGCAAISAGVHAGLVPAHLDDSLLVGSFCAAVVALAATAAALLFLPDRVWPARAAWVLFGGLIAAYAVTRTGEPVDVVGAGTKVVELAGLLLALSLPSRPRVRAARTPGIGWLALLLALAGVLAASHGHDAHAGAEGHDHPAHHHG